MDKLTIKMKNLFLAFLLFASTFASAQVTDAYMKQQADTIGRTTYTPTRAKHSIYNIVNSKVNVSTTVNGHPLSSNVTVTKSDLGLGNVDNTSDANKPAAGSNTQIQFNNSGLFGASPSLYYNNSTNVFNAAQTTTIVGSGTRTDNLYLGLNHTDSTVSGPNRWNMVVGEQHFVTNKSSSARKTINDSFLYGGYYNKIGISSTGGGGVAMSGVFGGHNNIVESFNNNIAFGNVVIGGWLNSIRPTSSVSADRVVGNFILAGSHNISDGYGSGTMGYWGQSSGYYSLVHGYVTTFTNGLSFSGVPSANFDSNHEVQHTSTVPRVLASGLHAVNISANSPSQTAGHGALGDYSVILGGINSNIPSNAEASVVLGGHNMKMLSADSATVYVPRIRDRSGIGSGTRMVTVDATGHYSNQAIPSGGGSGWGTSGSTTVTTPHIIGTPTFDNIIFDSATSVSRIQFKSKQSSAYGDYFFSLKDNDFGDTEHDQVMNWGYNTNGSGGRINTSNGAMWISMESHFNGISDDDFEFHCPEILSRDGSTNVRVLSMNIAKDLSNSESFWHIKKQEWRPLLTDNPYFSIQDGTTEITNLSSGQANLNIIGSGGSSSIVTFNDGLKFINNSVTKSAMVFNNSDNGDNNALVTSNNIHASPGPTGFNITALGVNASLWYYVPSNHNNFLRSNDGGNWTFYSTTGYVFDNSAPVQITNFTTAGVVVNDASGNLSTSPKKAGSFSGSGTATTVFTVTFGNTQANTSYKVMVTPTSALSAALFYVTNKTTTTFDVTYLAGLTGTVSFDYLVEP